MMPINERAAALEKVIRIRSHKNFLVFCTEDNFFSARLTVLEKWLRDPDSWSASARLIKPYMVLINEVIVKYGQR